MAYLETALAAVPGTHDVDEVDGLVVGAVVTIERDWAQVVANRIEPRVVAVLQQVMPGVTIRDQLDADVGEFESQHGVLWVTRQSSSAAGSVGARVTEVREGVQLLMKTQRGDSAAAYQRIVEAVQALLNFSGDTL